LTGAGVVDDYSLGDLMPIGDEAVPGKAPILASAHIADVFVLRRLILDLDLKFRILQQRRSDLLVVVDVFGEAFRLSMRDVAADHAVDHALDSVRVVLVLGLAD
jgi:hypothetical protein